MKCVLRITGLVVLCVGLSVLAQDIVAIKWPDLVILEVTFEATSETVEWSTYRFGIRIKNIGTGPTILTTVAVLIVDDVTKPVRNFAQDVPPIAAGGVLMVFVEPVIAGRLPPRCCVIVVVDPPVAGAPLGKVTEGFIAGGAFLESAKTQLKGERNNGFVFFYARVAGGSKQSFKNPAFEP